MRYSILVFFLGMSLFANGQSRMFSKLSDIYESGDYKDCIDKAEKYESKGKDDLAPYYFQVLSYYQLAKNEANGNFRIGYMRSGARKMFALHNADKNGEYLKNVNPGFAEQWKQFATFVGDSLYEAESQDDAVFFYDYILRIYEDTTAIYGRILDKKVAENLKAMSDAERDFATLSPDELKSVNQQDNQGRKQGLWIKFYPNQILAYRITFKDDKPIGDYRRYHENGKLKAKLFYHDNGLADATLYANSGERIATGQYNGTQRAGKWTMWMDSVKVAEEAYVDGIIHGKVSTFSPHGELLEEITFDKGIKNGPWRQFFVNGKVQMETKYVDDELNGPFYMYHQNGNFDTRGYYKDDLKDGKWLQYDLYGNLVNETIYTRGLTQNQIEIEKKEQEIKNLEDLLEESTSGQNIEKIQQLKTKLEKARKELEHLEAISIEESESQELIKLEENINKLKDPEKYRNNPQEYIRQ